MKRILFVCNTVYQILTAINIRMTMRKDSVADIIISNVVVNGNHICEVINETDFFNQAYFVQSKKYEPVMAYKNTNLFCQKWTNFLIQKNPKKRINQYVTLEGHYDELFFSNTGGFINELFRVLKNDNKFLKAFCFEDGTSSYTITWRDWFEEERILYSKGKSFRKLLGIHYLVDELDGYMVYRPELMDWKPKCSVIKISQINRENNDLRNAINAIFEYEKCEDIYDEKLIYFEDYLSAEGEFAREEKVILELISCVGKENIMVKRHPRSKNDIYLKHGIKVNRNLSIPWEVIALNIEDLEEKVLISHISGSIAMPYLIAGMHTKSISLVLCEESIKDCTYNVIQTWLIDKVYTKFKDIFSCPTSFEELCRMLS